MKWFGQIVELDCRGAGRNAMLCQVIVDIDGVTDALEAQNIMASLMTNTSHIEGTRMSTQYGRDHYRESAKQEEFRQLNWVRWIARAIPVDRHGRVSVTFRYRDQCARLVLNSYWASLNATKPSRFKYAND